ncbi:MAG: hypothetical protein HC907_35270 [Richelia sp. SM1_7_0]|nr:hypothetical protein [Richelia sp. SM1_7_0]
MQSDLINYHSNFQVFFGLNSTQTSSQLIIKKSDLPGLTASANNTAESLFVVLLINALSVYEYSSAGISSRLWGFVVNQNKRVYTIVVELCNKLNITDDEFTNYTETINPMDY